MIAGTRMILRVSNSCNGNSSTGLSRVCGQAWRSRKEMIRSLALLILFSAVFACAQAQSGSHFEQAAAAQSTKSVDEASATARALAALKSLNSDVFVYQSLGEFEGSQKLARVPYGTFQAHLLKATADVEDALPRISDPRLKTEINNALASYRDGEYWWKKVYQPRVINVSSLSFTNTECGPADTFFTANIPYNVAIH